MPRHARSPFVVILVIALIGAGCAPIPAAAAPRATPRVAVAASASGFPGTVILGRPTDTSAVVSLMASSTVDVYVEHGAASGQYAGRSAITRLKAGQPVEITLTGLVPDSSVFYRLRYRQTSKVTFQAAPEQVFHTQRAVTDLPGDGFVFDVQADPHVDIDRKMVPTLFRQQLANVRADHPDFLVDLGDTFLGDKFATSYSELAAQYANARSYFGITGPSIPLYLVNGNHEGEAGWLLNGTANNLSVWAANARKLYYPEPSAGSFYRASTVQEPFVGARNSYYAWEWGDALFVVLDPYSYTTVNPKQSGDGWDWTLGEAQYRWLADVLSTSDRTYKFVFSHHAVGDIRGGVELADLYEWGGNSKNGTYQFDLQRPGWGQPIHRLFAACGVTIFFQGHDHLYVRQERDGVVYQEVPQPASPGAAQNADAYWSGGVVFPSTGHLRVTVAGSGVTVAYVHSSVGTGDTSGYANGEVVYSYTVARPSGS